MAEGNSSAVRGCPPLALEVEATATTLGTLFSRTRPERTTVEEPGHICLF